MVHFGTEFHSTIPRWQTPNLQRWPNSLINRQHTQSSNPHWLSPPHVLINKDWGQGVEPVALMLSQSMHICKLLPSQGKNERGKGSVSQGERECSEKVIKALTPIFTKQLSLLRLGFYGVAVKQSSQRVLRINPPFLLQNTQVRSSGRESFSHTTHQTASALT